MDTSKLYADLISSIGEDLNRDGLHKTPERAARAFSFLTQGYQQSLDDIVNGAVFDSDNEEMVIVKDIELYSLCEHHMLPFVGRAHVAYLPQGKVLGLSKVARITDMYARRLQIQENLTKQIAETILQVTHAAGVGVVIEAQHFCMMMRGVQNAFNIEVVSSLLKFEKLTPNIKDLDFTNMASQKEKSIAVAMFQCSRANLGWGDRP